KDNGKGHNQKGSNTADFRKGSECDFTASSSSDGSATRYEDRGVVELKSAPDNLAVATFLFDFEKTTAWKFSAEYNGEGKLTVLFGKSSDDKTIEGVSLELSKDRTSETLSLADVSRFKNKDGEIEVQIITDNGKIIIVKSVKIEYLEDKPEVKVVYRDVFPDSHTYGPWYYYYSGPLYHYDYYNGYYVVYRSWRDFPDYGTWRISVAYRYNYYYQNSVYCYCPPQYVYYNPCYYETRAYNYGGRRTTFVQRKQKPATYRASASTRSMTGASQGQVNKGALAQKSANQTAATNRKLDAASEIKRLKTENQRRETQKSQGKEVSLRQRIKNGISSLGRKGNQAIETGGRGNVPLKRNASSASSNTSSSTRQRGTTEATHDVNRVRETQQPQRQVQPAPSSSSTTNNDDDEDKNNTPSSSSSKTRISPR
ncbi:hypothetical protein KKF47_00900, partial [Patescibacteria group bacterium]|nr:hypothetical protein [Patescibacteria group bacterium]